MFRELKSKIPINDTLRASQIVFKVSKTAGSSESTKKRLSAIREKLIQIDALEKLIQEFTIIASRQSESPEAETGGDIGNFHPKDFFPEFEKAVKPLKVGDLSSVFKSPVGYHLVLLTEKNDGNFENYKIRLLQVALAEQTAKNQKTLQDYLVELSKKYKVTYSDSRFQGKLSAHSEILGKKPGR